MDTEKMKTARFITVILCIIVIIFTSKISLEIGGNTIIQHGYQE